MLTDSTETKCNSNPVGAKGALPSFSKIFKDFTDYTSDSDSELSDAVEDLHFLEVGCATGDIATINVHDVQRQKANPLAMKKHSKKVALKVPALPAQVDSDEESGYESSED